LPFNVKYGYANAPHCYVVRALSCSVVIPRDTKFKYLYNWYWFVCNRQCTRFVKVMSSLHHFV